MDLLRNLGSAAASSLLQKSGITLPYSLGSKVTEYDGKSIWNLYDATKKDDSSVVSVFHFDASASNRHLVPFAKNALKKLRTTRHPDILKFLDVVEQGDSIWIMTERVRPLRSVLFSWDNGTAKAKEKNKAREEWTIWGLHRVAIALAFLNDTCASSHGNISIDSIFLSPSGEWRLGGLETLSSTKDENPILFTIGQQLPRPLDVSSPEVKKSGWNALKESPSGVCDAYALGILMHCVFNLTIEPPQTVHPPHSAPTASSRGSIPTEIFPLFKKLLNPSAKPRLSCQAFLDIGMGVKAGVDGAPGRFFVDNHLVKVCSQLEGFPLASDGEKLEFLKTLKESASSFPPEFAIHRLIPALIASFEHGGTSAATVIPLIFELSKIANTDPVGLDQPKRGFQMDPAQYKTVILMPVMKLYARPDRGTRMALLEALPEYEGKLDEKTVQDTIWPHFQTGFADTVPVIREATVKAVSVLAPKFSSRILNNDLLRHLAKAQSDPEPSIRTNTCILIARLAPSLSAITKKKVLIPAFSKALKDPFVHARVAGVMGLTACVESFDIEDAATKVLGIIGSGLIDKEKIVRDPAFKCLESYRAKVQAYADSMPETALLPDGSAPAASITSYTGQAPSDLLSAATGVAGGVAGWAFESISSRLVSRDAPTKPGAAVTVSAPITPALNTETKTVIPTPSPTASVRSVPSSKVGTKGKGMALGSKLGTKGGQAALMAELEKEMQKDETDFANAWGDDDPYASNAPNGQTDLGGDLMDVNADQDDWTPFESASPQTANPTIKSLRSIVQADNPWQGSTDDLAAAFNKPTTYSTLSTQVGGMSQSPNSPTPAKQRLGAVSAQSTYSNTVPSTPSTAQSPTMASKSTDDWGGFGASDMVAVDTDKVETSKSASASSTGNLAGMTKEEKAAEMARRREERKARIAQLKEQKKGGT